MKKIICLLLIALLIPSGYVYADESDVSGTKKYTYTMEYVSIDSYGYEYKDGEDYVHIVKGQGTIESDYKLVAYRVSRTPSEVCIVLLNDDGSVYKNTGRFLGTLGDYTTMSGYTEYGIAYLDTLEFEKSKFSSYYSSNNTLTGYLIWYEDAPYWKENSPGKLNTNIPIFENYSDFSKYLSGELTEKDATNYETDICNIKYDLEVPQNLKVEFDLVGIFRDPEYRFNWEQTDQNYTKWDTEIYVYGDFEGYDSILGIPIGDDYVFEEEFIYKETIDTYKLRYVIAPETYIYENGYDAVIERLLELEMNGTFSVGAYHVYLRNSYFDGDEQHYSNWVYVNFDHDFSGVNDLVVFEVEGSFDDTPGNVGTGSGTGINGNINSDSQYDGSVDANWDESNDDIFTWISNGFGLGGDNGVITLLSDTFSFIPSELWAVFMSGIALMVLISVVKWVRG